MQAGNATGAGEAVRRRCLVTLVIATILYLLSLWPWFVIYFVSLMGGGGSLVARIALYAALVYPLLVVVSLVAGWILWARGSYRWAFWSLAVPPADVLLYALMLALAYFTARPG